MSFSSDFPKKNRLKAQARQKSEPMDKAAGKYIFLCDENEISKPIKIITDLNLSKTYYCKKKRLSQVYKSWSPHFYKTNLSDQCQIFPG